MAAGQLDKIAHHLATMDTYIAFTILAFDPKNRMLEYRAPDTSETIAAYLVVNAFGLRNMRLGNLSVFVRIEKDLDLLNRNMPLEDR